MASTAKIPVGMSSKSSTASAEDFFINQSFRHSEPRRRRRISGGTAEVLRFAQDDEAASSTSPSVILSRRDGEESPAARPRSFASLRMTRLHHQPVLPSF